VKEKDIHIGMSHKIATAGFVNTLSDVLESTPVWLGCHFITQNFYRKLKFTMTA